MAETTALPPAVRERLKKIAGKRLTSEGILIIKAQRFRSQDQNRQDAVDRLVAMIQKALEAPRQRKATRPTAASKTRRLTTKRRRGELKRRRRAVRQSGDDI